MSFGGPSSRRVSFGGIAIAGLVAGHCFAHKFFTPIAGPHAHHHHVTHSHGPWLLALVVGLAIALAGSFLDHRLGARRPKLGTKAGVLLAVQLTGFVGVSILDRVTGAVGTEIGSRAFWAGLMLQVIAAALGAIVLVAFRKAIATIEKVIRRLRSSNDTPVLLPAVSFRNRIIVPLVLAVGGPTFRGPPLRL
jgi:hypothetical protein